MASPRETTIVRPWRWGIVIVADAGSGIPEVVQGQLASTGPYGVILRVRHAQDVVIPDDAADDSVYEASASVHVSVHAADVDHQRATVCDVTFATPSGRVTIGDAEDELAIDWAGADVRLIASADSLDPFGLDEVWIDLMPGLDEPDEVSA